MLSTDQPSVADQVPDQLFPVAALIAPTTLSPGHVSPAGAPGGATGVVGSCTVVCGTSVCPGISIRTVALVAAAVLGTARSSAQIITNPVGRITKPPYVDAVLFANNCLRIWVNRAKVE